VLRPSPSRIPLARTFISRNGLSSRDGMAQCRPEEAF
jgi:hypothetical protein